MILLRNYMKKWLGIVWLYGKMINIWRKILLSGIELLPSWNLTSIGKFVFRLLIRFGFNISLSSIRILINLWLLCMAISFRNFSNSSMNSPKSSLKQSKWHYTKTTQYHKSNKSYKPATWTCARQQQPQKYTT